VNNSGDISWHKGRVFVSEAFRNEEIGLEQMNDDVHRVFFCNTELGEFNTSEMRFRPVLRTWRITSVVRPGTAIRNG
jgi:hypothetical protein